MNGRRAKLMRKVALVQCAHANIPTEISYKQKGETVCLAECYRIVYQITKRQYKDWQSGNL